MSLTVPGAVIADSDVEFYEDLVRRRDGYATQCARTEDRCRKLRSEIQRLQQCCIATALLLEQEA